MREREKQTEEDNSTVFKTLSTQIISVGLFSLSVASDLLAEEMISEQDVLKVSVGLVYWMFVGKRPL